MTDLRPTLTLRDARPGDAAGCAAIYAPYVHDTSITFEEVAPTASEIRARITARLASHAWLVAEDEGRLLGYAYAGPFKERSAYRWSCETSVYVDAHHHRGGVGRALYLRLLQQLASRGLRTAVGVITLPNEASIRLHEALGFRTVGVLPAIGYKLGAWHDVAWLACEIGHVGTPPAEPT